MFWSGNGDSGGIRLIACPIEEATAPLYPAEPRAQTQKTWIFKNYGAAKYPGFWIKQLRSLISGSSTRADPGIRPAS